jgi:hypothetical protein
MFQSNNANMKHLCFPQSTNFARLQNDKCSSHSGTFEEVENGKKEDRKDMTRDTGVRTKK